MANSRSLLSSSGSRQNNQLLNSRRNDYQSDQRNEQLFQRRPATSVSRNNRYLDGHSDHYLDSLQDRQSDNVTDGWNNHLVDNRNDLLDNRNDLLDTRNDLLDTRNNRLDTRNNRLDTRNNRLDTRNNRLDSRNDLLDGRNNRHHLEKQYDQYISELESKSLYADLGRNNTNSDLGRNSRFMDFDKSPVSKLGTNDRFADLERHISNRERNSSALGLGQSNPLSSLVQNNRLLELERSNLRSSLGSSSITPWQVGAGPINNSSHLPIDAVSNKVVSTIELANNLLSLFQQQPQQNTPPSLLDLPVRAPQSHSFNSGIGRTSMGNHQRSATDSRFGASKRKANWAPAGQSQQSKNFPRKDNNISSKAKPRTSDQSSSNAGMPKKNDNKQIDTDYSEILSNLLNCHICKKTITEAKSFVTHLKGKAHAAMMQKTADDYALTADKMREEIRAIESMKANKHTSQNFHCSMCNINAASAKEHRSSVGHRKLKKYLHPSCNTCNLNMSTRIDYDEHVLTVGHLKKLQAKVNPAASQKTELGDPQKTVPAAAKVMQIFNMDMEKVYVRERFERKRGKKTTKDDKPKDGDSMEQNVNKKDDEVQGSTESDNLVLDYVEGDDLTGVTPNMIPGYSTERAVGDSFLSEFRCVQCKLCDKLLDNEETAKIHLRTWGHHKQFTRLIMSKIKSTKENDEQNKDLEGTGGKQRQSIEESGNWKRRKTSNKSFVEQQDDAEIPENDRQFKNETSDSQLPPNEELEDWDQEDDKIDIKEENDEVILIEE